MFFLYAILQQMPQNKAKGGLHKKKIYDHLTIEPKWQAKWEKERVYQPAFEAANQTVSSKDEVSKVKKSKTSHKKPFYNLMMFPYPSAEGLHVGSMYAFGGVDVFGRFKRMKGYEVFEPIGLDGFGIHSENHAIKTNTHPIDHAKRTQKNFYRQLHAIGNSFAWDNKVETYEPDYYRWTQWIFVQLFKSGLAYKKNSPVNFCPSCKTVLSDEQVIDGKCERCNSVVEKRDLEQWFFRITNYAEKLLSNIKDLDWSEKVRLAQKNWIGKSEGVRFKFSQTKHVPNVEVFTTAIDTVFGVTFVVISPEHPLLKQIMSSITDKKRKDEVQKYVKKSSLKSTIDRLAEGKEKTGVFTGAYVKNPLTDEEVPLWVADYVLMDYGTGIVMGVPGHDARDHEFAQKFGLEIRPVIKPKQEAAETHVLEDGFWNYQQIKNEFQDKSELFNSGKYNGMSSKEAKPKLIEEIESKGYGKREVTYHLRDWLISRQRYWGPPIPMIYCEECSKRKPKVLIIHGIAGDSSDNWFPWVKPLLEQRGYEVLIPDLPNSQNPTLAEWTNALSKIGITKQDNLSVVAHSLGAPTAIEFIRKNQLSVKKLILVAPVGKEIEKVNWEALTSGGYEFVKPILQRFSKANDHVAEIAERVEKTMVYLSENDPYIPLTIEKSYAALQPTLEIFKKHGHFNAGAGILEFPKILEEFPAIEESSLGWVPVPEEELPVKLPYIKNFKPLGTGKAPLANHPEFYKTKCPHCGGTATRETDVSDTFLDSAWYFLRYLATDWKNIPFPSFKYLLEHSEKSENQKAKKSDGQKLTYAEFSEKVKSRSRWLPVTSYIGGAEHSVLHLLYSRFITMALKDMGYVDFEEPFSRFYAHGLIIKDGAKMSKSKGNVINPDDYIHKYGADTLRTYLLFLGPFNQGGDFRDSGIDGMSRFLKRVWKLLQQAISDKQQVTSSQERMRFMHETIKGITEDMENLRFNTAIAKLMTYYNFLAKQAAVSREEVEVYLKLLAPFAPHITEELWQESKSNKQQVTSNEFQSIHTSDWPNYDEKYLKKETVTIAVQVNGKLRGTLVVSVSNKADQQLLEKMARCDEHVAKFLKGTVKKVILVPGKILNFVVS